MSTSIFPYVGGKTRLQQIVSDNLEIAREKFQLRGVLSVCGGSAVELLCLRPGWDWILYNEIDQGVAAIFAALSTESTTKEMIRLAKQRPYTYEDYQENQKLWKQGYPGFSLAEKAAYAYTLVMQSYRGILGNCAIMKVTDENCLDYEEKSVTFITDWISCRNTAPFLLTGQLHQETVSPYWSSVNQGRIALPILIPLMWKMSAKLHVPICMDGQTKRTKSWSIFCLNQR